MSDIKVGDYVQYHWSTDQRWWMARVVGVWYLRSNRRMLNLVRSDGGATTVLAARCLYATERDFLTEQAGIALLGGRHDVQQR